jgi:hypothetical protein
MLFPGKDYRRRPADDIVAAEDAGRLAVEAAAAVDDAVGSGWYIEQGGKVDLAAFALCKLRRAKAGELGGPELGDEAVRVALADARPDAVIWLASRAISYLDENGFPEAVEPWFTE